MELIGNDAGIREEVFYKTAITITHVDDDVSYVFTSINILKLRDELSFYFSKGHFAKAFVLIVCEDGYKLCPPSPSSEEMLIDSNG